MGSVGFAFISWLFISVTPENPTNFQEDYSRWVKPEVCRSNIIYKCLNDGAESVFNPVTVSLSAGTEEIYFQNPSRKLNTFPYDEGWNVVAESMKHPFKHISQYGWDRFLRNEIFPGSFSTKRMQWVPNYTLHLFGGGFSSRELEEWYAAHGFIYPKVWMFINYQAYQFLNEVYEGRFLTGTNVDPIADLYIFNLAGILLFQWDKAARFFNDDLHFRDWSSMPTFNLYDGSIHNNLQRFSMKIFSPWSDRIGLMVLLGLEGMAGFTYKYDEEKSISITGGVQPKYIRIYTNKNAKAAELTWKSGIFWDRNDNLLASLTYSHRFDEGLSLNVYPGIFKIGNQSFGLWLARKPGDHYFAGITTIWTPGVGAGPRTL